MNILVQVSPEGDLYLGRGVARLKADEPLVAISANGTIRMTISELRTLMDAIETLAEEE